MNDAPQSTIDPDFEDQALLFVSGGMPEPKRHAFELLLQCDAGVREYAASLSEAAASLTVGTAPPAPDDLKNRIMALTEALPQNGESLVMSSPEGRVRWASPCFLKMCGYAMDELEGRKLGPILQGEKTDVGTAARLRQAVREAVPFREVIVNYHKNGTPYWVEIDLAPIADDAGKVLCFIAQEFERRDLPLP